MDNRMAWILAGIFGAIVLVVIVWVVFFPSPTAPTHRTLARGRMDFQKPRHPLTHVMPAAPAGDGDAGDDYHQAIALLKERWDGVVAACRGNGALSPGDRKLLEEIHAHLAAGAGKREMTYAFRYTPQEFVIDYSATEAGDFQDLANVPVRRYEHHLAAGKDSYGQAEKVLFDLLVMGHHMVAERARLESVLTGAELQREACTRLRTLYGSQHWSRPDKGGKAQEYSLGLEGLLNVYAVLRREVIWTFQPDVVAGDVFNLVENHPDRCIRVEATLALGPIKLAAGGRGNKRYTRKLIDRQLARSDPLERAAARAAAALDAEGLNRLMNPPQ